MAASKTTSLRIFCAVPVPILSSVDLGFHSQNSDEIDTILEILIQSLDIMGQANTEVRLEQTADVVIQPVTGSASLTDIEKVPAIIAAGRRAALEAWPQIALLVQNFAKRRAKAQPHFHLKLPKSNCNYPGCSPLTPPRGLAYTFYTNSCLPNMCLYGR